MKAIIICIGDELLIGQTINTNASWISQQLNKMGVEIHEVITIADNESHIIESLINAQKKAGVILITGGLGPTNDDVTKNALCKYFRSRLVLDKTIFKDVSLFFEKRNRQLTDRNKSQAMVPHNCTPIRNSLGTAPGMFFLKKNKMVVSMPGVPFEMKKMMTNFVIPQIKKRHKLAVIIHKNILVAEIGESFLADKIKDWEEHLPDYIKLAYLPHLGNVKLRLTGKGENEKILDKEINFQIKKLKTIISEFIAGENEDTLEMLVGKLLKNKKATVATAESCTGGYIAHLLTSVAGSSGYYKGSIISYSNDIKVSELGVKKNTLKKQGAVSEEVCKEMLEGILKKYKTDYAIAVTGIAGPGGGTKEKPVGTVWIGVGNKKNIAMKRYFFSFERTENIIMTAMAALNDLRKIILNDNLSN